VNERRIVAASLLGAVALAAAVGYVTGSAAVLGVTPFGAAIYAFVGLAAPQYLLARQTGSSLRRGLAALATAFASFVLIAGAATGPVHRQWRFGLRAYSRSSSSAWRSPPRSTNCSPATAPAGPEPPRQTYSSSPRRRRARSAATPPSAPTAPATPGPRVPGFAVVPSVRAVPCVVPAVPRVVPAVCRAVVAAC